MAHLLRCSVAAVLDVQEVRLRSSLGRASDLGPFSFVSAKNN
jgi:hypothetical protein